MACSFVNSDLEAVSCYFGIVVLLVVLGVIIYNALLKTLPRITMVITGGRN